jgi:hypothetical protein
MKQFIMIVVAVSFAAFASSGCNLGNAPEAMSADQARSALNKMSPQDQIKYVATSPMSAEDKQKRYADIEAKTGVKASDVLGANGAPVTGSGPTGR